MNKDSYQKIQLNRICNEKNKNNYVNPSDKLVWLKKRWVFKECIFWPTKALWSHHRYCQKTKINTPYQIGTVLQQLD